MKKIYLILILIFLIQYKCLAQKTKFQETFIENIKINNKNCKVYLRQMTDSWHTGYDSGDSGQVYIFYFTFKKHKKEIHHLAKLLKGKYSNNKIKREGSHRIVDGNLEINERIYDYHFPSHTIEVLKVNQYGYFDVVSHLDLKIDETNLSDEYVKQVGNNYIIEEK